MRKYGTVISVIKEKNGYEKLGILLDNSQIENSCSVSCGMNICPSVKEKTERRCAVCGGCSAGKNRSGLLAVSGNRITALNKTGKNIKAGDKVEIETDEKKIKLQTLSSIILPILLSIIFALSFYFFLKTEDALLAGTFLGLAAGVCFALCVKKILGDIMLPTVYKSTPPTQSVRCAATGY